jgi:hypothetical protein
MRTLPTLLIAGIAGFSACSPAFRPADYPLATGYPILPVVLSPDTTTLLIADFAPDGAVPDSVVWDDPASPIEVVSGPDGPAVTIVGGPKLAMGQLRMYFGTRALDIPVMRSDIERVLLKREFPGAQSVAITGAMNGWNATATPFARTADGWELELELPAGAHPYRLVVDGAWQLDPLAAAASPSRAAGLARRDLFPDPPAAGERRVRGEACTGRGAGSVARTRQGMRA